MAEMKTDLLGAKVVYSDGEVATIRGVRPADDNPQFFYVLVEWADTGKFGTYPLHAFVSKAGHDAQVEREMEKELFEEEMAERAARPPAKKSWLTRLANWLMSPAW